MWVTLLSCVYLFIYGSGVAVQKRVKLWPNFILKLWPNFILNKGEFRDAISLRYNESVTDLPSKCPCGDDFNINHALNCKRGGFVIMRHDNIRDYEAKLLRKVCNDVETEPHLQPLEGESVTGAAGDNARPDIRARGIWRRAQNGFFDVMVTNVFSSYQANSSTETIYARHESAKKRSYNDRIMNVEHGSFTPLVFSVNGGTGPEATRFHQHIAQLISEKTDEKYDKVLGWIRCKLSFLILRACLTCLRGSRPHGNKYADAVPEDITLASAEAQLRY